MGNKSKVRQHTHYFTDQKTKQKSSNSFVEGGMFGGKSRYLSPNVPMKLKKRPGTKFIAGLPPGYDKRTRITKSPNEDAMIVAHPDFRPIKVWPDGRREDIVYESPNHA